MLKKLFKKLCRKPKKQNGFVISLAVAIGAAVASALVGVGVGVGTALVIGTIAAYATIGATIYGGIALCKSLSGGGRKSLSSGLSTSPTYANSVQQTQTNNQLPIPLLYGEVKVAGNRIWQNDGGESTIKRLVAFGEGEFEDFTDIRLNDILYTEISGCTITKFYGTSTQQISDLITGASNAARAEVVGGLKYLAYLAISVPKSDKVDVNYNLTCVAKGRKVRIYTDESTYTTAYSNNPAWCFLDFLTAYNGAKLCRQSDGSLSDAEIAKYIDVQSFIDAAAYCDADISYYELTTALTGNNNDLIWQSRKSGADGAYNLVYSNPATPNATASIAYTSGTKTITINLATNGSSVITTTANDIVSLIANSTTLNDLVKVYNADSNDGSGVVTALSSTAFIEGDSTPRYAFNMIFDSKFSVYDVIEQFKLNCNGAFTRKGEKFQFKIDKAEDTAKVFTDEDIIQGSEEVKPLPLEERYDILKIKIIDPDNEWSKVDVQAELEEHNNNSAVSHEVEIFSITNTAQGRRQAWHYLNRNRLCQYLGKFSTDYKAADLEVGDVIEIPVLMMDWTDYLVKVTSVIDDGSGVFDVYWRTYNADLYTDELGSQEITVNYIPVEDIRNKRAATFIIAASNSQNKEQADFVVSEGAENAQDTINQAINSVELKTSEYGSTNDTCTTTSIVFDSTASENDDFYNGLYIKFTSGNCAEESAKLITDYAGSTQTATVEAFTNTPSNGDSYEIQAYYGKILLLEGTYTIDDSIILKSGISLEGMGASSLIKLSNTTEGYDGGAYTFITAITSKDSEETVQEININNISIDCNKDNVDVDRIFGIGFENSSKIKINKLSIKNYTWSGVAAVNCTFIEVNSVKAIANSVADSVGIDLYGTTNSSVVTCEAAYNEVGILLNNNCIKNNIIDCVCRYNDEIGILVGNGSEDNNIVGNQCTYNDIGNIYLDSSDNNNISNNNCSFSDPSSGTSGLILYTSSNNNVIGNVVNSNAVSGIDLADGSNNNNIQNNLCVGNGTDGLGGNCNIILSVGYGTTGCSYNNVQNNICRSGGITTWGLVLSPGSNYNKITDNDLKGSQSYGSGSYYNAGTGTITTSGNRT